MNIIAVFFLAPVSLSGFHWVNWFWMLMISVSPFLTVIGWFIVGGKHQLRLYFVMAVLVFFSCSCWIHLVVVDSTSPPLTVYKIYISIVQNVQLWGSTEGLTHDRVNHWNLMHVASLMWPRGHYYCLNSVFFIVASLDLLVYLTI